MRKEKVQTRQKKGMNGNSDPASLSEKYSSLWKGYLTVFYSQEGRKKGHCWGLGRSIVLILLGNDKKKKKVVGNGPGGGGGKEEKRTFPSKRNLLSLYKLIQKKSRNDLPYYSVSA